MVALLWKESKTEDTKCFRHNTARGTPTQRRVLLNTEQLTILKEKAKKNRLLALEGIYSAKSGHPGGSFSIAELVTYLYSCEMNVSPETKDAPDRDRLVLSKGHAAPALYAALAQNGFFPEDTMKTLRRVGSILQGHPDSKKTPGIDMSTGSLGQGLSTACGMALVSDGKYNVYCIVGDGELQEGQIWEAAMLANHYHLKNLYVFVDYNKVQLTGPVDDMILAGDIAKKFDTFGWHTVEIDGHDFEAIEKALKACKGEDRPSAIICHTVKGKGVSFMEGSAKWHGNAPNAAQYEAAVNELLAAK